MWLTVKEASEYYKIKKSTLYLWVSQGRIPHYKIGQLIRFKSEVLDGWMEKFKKDADMTMKPLRIYPSNSTDYDTDRIVRKAIDDCKGDKV